MKRQRIYLGVAAMVAAGTLSALAQTSDSAARRPAANPTQEASPPPAGRPGQDDGSQGGPGAFGPGGPGHGGFGDMHTKTALVKQFDRDGNGWLNSDERKAAREYLAKQPRNPGARGPGGRRGGFGGPGGDQTPVQPGPKLTPAEVKSFAAAPVYEPSALRTFFLEFDNPAWEKELAEFKNTDVEVPAKLSVDGKTYPDVGVRFRGNTSFMMIGEGRKRPLNLALDFIHKDQQLNGCRTFNLLNSNDDPTFLRTVLFLQIARDYIPAPKANFTRVVINGESWGVYVNVQQFNKDFVQEWFGTTKGARWKVPGSPNGRGGLSYLGQEAAPYKQIYEIKTKDNPKAWASLIKLCQTLSESPADQLERALAPLLDIDHALRFLALDNALFNNDGFWTRASDYYLYLDDKGRFHFIPNDVNETFSTGGGPGGGRGRGGPGGGGARVSGVELDPLIDANDANKPLLSKLLAVPSLRARYLGYVREIAEKWLDWNKLGPVARQYQALIAEDMKRDTRKINSTEAFMSGITGEGQTEAGAGRGRQPISLKSFAEQRRAYLLNYPGLQKN